MHCEHCMLAGVPPTDRTYKTMCIHLHSTDPKKRCPCVGHARIRKPETLLNVCDAKKKHHKKTLVRMFNAEEILKQFIECHLTCSKDEINVIVDWVLMDFQAHSNFPVGKKMGWDLQKLDR